MQHWAILDLAWLISLSTMSNGLHLSAEIRERAVRAVSSGMSRTIVATAFGVDRATLYRWLKKYERDGCPGLQRQSGSGRRRKFDDIDANAIRALVLKGPLHFGFETDLWTVSRLRRVIKDEFSIVLSKNSVWRRLRDAGLTYQKPEREYYEIDEKARKKWLRYEVPKIRRCVQKYRGILYFQDESNVSLTAFLGKTWAPCGETPKA
ncbi:MAG: IS630 family transposase, partial [Planctomycetes bacterium]|nr:IS630 family transposase [Planctomycetota bacterium]